MLPSIMMTYPYFQNLSTRYIISVGRIIFYPFSFKSLKVVQAKYGSWSNKEEFLLSKTHQVNREM